MTLNPCHSFLKYGGLEVLLAILIRINIPDRRNQEKPTKEGEFPVEELLKETEKPKDTNVGGED